MKHLTLLFSGLILLAPKVSHAGGVPRGTLLELHSCQLFAGGCVVSSEATLGGRYMLRVWNFTGGSFGQEELGGLQLAVLQSSPDNLAAPGSESGAAVLYLPWAATSAQREALAAWLRSSQPDFRPATLQTRVVPLRLVKTGNDYTFSAGDFISLKTAPMETCATFACGDSLWYQPRAATSLFTVAVDRASQISEPLLRLKWDDSGKRNVFLARFGEPDSAKNLFMTLAEVCGPAQGLF